jgi:hypothetical protein
MLLEGGNADTGQQVLDQMNADLDDLDLVDQAEVLSASTWLCERTGGDPGEKRSQLAGCLSRLPDAVAMQLHRLGVLQI